MQPHNPAKNQKILVLGAGELGLAVVRALVLNPAAEVAVMLRPVAPEKISSERHQALHELESLGVEVLAGDAVNDSEEQLAASFGAFDTLVSCLGFVAGPGTQRKLTRAALQSDIKRYVPWQFGVDYDAIGRDSPQDLFDEQLDVRDLLRAQSRVQWLIISTGMFTSFLFQPEFGVVDLDNDTVRALGSWDTAVTVTTAQDIGRLTATILFDSTLRNQVVYTAGDTLTYGQLADTMERLLGRTLERVEWTAPALEADLRAEPDDQLRKYRTVFAQGKGVAWDKARTYNGERQIETTNVAQWIEQNLF
ncbi:aromatic alcohol reductase [Pseudomonas sp. P97.38]|uniref:aromatic alcohol reductase n=1 Tax=Pseudomonas sp. P97.38 TaxID=255451 RepID=UPI00069CE3E1|nr:aromatic alcohol reductase [Pseudomonas sp. P97.38]